MSKKRTASESSNDEQTTEGSDPVCQQPDDAKRAKLVSLSDTTLQDLPIELLECILVRLVAMEVKGMKMAKSVWKEKVDPVIDRLRTVCSQWNSICATKFFRNELYRTLDVTAPESIRLEILRRYPIQYSVFEETALKDEIFMFCKPDGEDYVINVYDCNNMGEVKDVIQLPAQETIRLEILHQYPIPFPVNKITAMKDEIFILRNLFGDGYVINVYDCNNMAEVKDVISLPGICPVDMAGCPVSNCVYVLNAGIHKSSKYEYYHSKTDSVLRITKAEEQQFKVSPWITDPKLLSITVSTNGSLITLSKQPRPNPKVVRIYAANGSLQHEMELSPDVYGFRSVENVIQRSNGNLVLVLKGNGNETLLMEIDTFGSVVNRYQSALEAETSVNFADIYGRILITNYQCSFELLDSELNLLDVTGLQPHEAEIFIPRKLHFNSERNEMMSIYRSQPSNDIRRLTIFSFI